MESFISAMLAATVTTILLLFAQVHARDLAIERGFFEHKQKLYLVIPARAVQ